MTSRERVCQALDHKKTDRMPADFRATDSVTGKIIRYMGVVDEEELLQALGVDLRRILFDHNLPDAGPDADGYMRNMWGVKYPQDDPNRGIFKAVYPFCRSTTVDDVNNHPWPDPADLDFTDVAPRCKEYHESYVVYGSPWCPFFHEVGWIVGQENFFIWMETKPDVLDVIIRHIVAYELEATRLFLTAACGHIDITYFGNDFGTQRSLFISPAHYERFIRKPLKRFVELSHEFNCRVMKHSCGAVRPLLPRFIDDGIDILDPVQTAAAGMALDGLVGDFGDRICFHGGMDTQTLLPFGSTGDVRDTVRAFRGLTRDCGGYILAGSQKYIDDIPAENLTALYEENQRLRD